MSETTNQDVLLQKAQSYLKSRYGEDTVRMDVLKNSVQDGNGTLAVECTVRIGGATSDWQKTFTFRNGEVTGMDWKYLGG